MQRSINRFSVLREYDSDDDFLFKFPSKITHLELHPVAKLIKYRNITHLEPHPTSHLIKFICICYSILYKNKVRFTDLDYWGYKNKYKNCAYYIQNRNDNAYHGDILLQSELDRLKEQLESIKNKLEIRKSKNYKFIYKVEEQIHKIKEDCNTTCAKWLDQIHICTCNKCYECKNTNGIDKNDLGRCKHFYQIENLKEDIELYEEDINKYSSLYYDIKYRYDRELAKKEKYLDEYEQELDDDYDDYAFQESMNYSYYQRNYKEPVYIYINIFWN